MDDIAKEKNRKNCNEVNNVLDKATIKQQSKQANNSQTGTNVVNNVNSSNITNETGAKSKVPASKNNPAHKDK